MDNSRYTICSKCKKSVPVLDVKYIQDKTKSPIILCSACRGFKPDKVETKKDDKKINFQTQKSYHCLRCNHDFKAYVPQSNIITCPSCKKSEKIRENKIILAKDIIED